MATSTFTTKSHAFNMFAADDATYLKISQDATVLTRMNFDVKNAVDGSDNTTIKPYFRSLTFKEGAATTELSTRFASLDTSIATNAANIATNTTNVATNAANIAVNSTAISTEAGARAAADASLQAQIDAANTSVGTAIATLTADLATETANRDLDQEANGLALDNEILARQTAVAGVEAGYIAADTAIQTLVDVNTTNITNLQLNMNNILGLSTTTLDSFAEVAQAFDNIGLATINQRLSDLEAAVAALQNPP
jgi:hypothetical protein